jgi:hypothetical protein
LFCAADGKGEKGQLLSPVGSGQKGKECEPAVESCAKEWGSAPSRSADREEKKLAREERGKTRRLLPENGLLFAKSSGEIRKTTRV